MLLSAAANPAWGLITRLGEAQILLPVMLLTAAWMTRRVPNPLPTLLPASMLASPPASRPASPSGRNDGRLGALVWLVSMLVAAALTTISKVAFIGYEVGFAPWDYTGISGHAMFAFVVWPVLLAVIAGRRGPAYFAAAAGVLLALVIAVSRVKVRAHSPADALLGGVLGLAAAAATLAVIWRHGVGAGFPLWAPVLILVWFLATPSWAPRSRSHDLVTKLSLAVSGRPLPYTRAQMQHAWRAQYSAEGLASRAAARTSAR